MVSRSGMLNKSLFIQDQSSPYLIENALSAITSDGTFANTYAMVKLRKNDR